MLVWRAFGRSVLVLHGCACGTQDVRPPVFTQRDSSDVRIVQSAAPVVPDTLQVSEDPIAVIHSNFGVSDLFLYNVTSVLALADGGVLVGNGGTSEVYRFSAAHEFLGVSGGAGAGPGEFRGVTSLHRCEGTAFAVVSPLRINVFDSEGMHTQTVLTTGDLSGVRAQVIGVSPDCASALLSEGSVMIPKPGDELVEIPQTLYWATFGNGQRDTVAVVTTGLAQAWELDGRSGWARAPFGPRTVSVTHGMNTVVGLARLPEVAVYDQGGHVERIIRWGTSSIPLADDEWDRFAESYGAFLLEHPEEQAFVPRFDLYERPATRPAYQTLLVDTAERLWVQTYGAYGPFAVGSSRSWTVMDPDGRLRAHVQMPDGLTVLALTDTTVIGVVRDEVDVEHISIHRLPEPLVAAHGERRKPD